MNNANNPEHEHLRPSSIAWAVGLGAAALYEVFCPPGETLSERVDPILEGRYKYVALSAIAITGLHLANMLPKPIDPYHQLTRFKSW